MKIWSLVLLLCLFATTARGAYNACDVMRRMNEMQSNAPLMRSYNGRAGKFRVEFYRDVRVSSQIRKKIHELKGDRWVVVDDVVVK